MTQTTASQVIARSATPVTTYTIRELPADYFTAAVEIGGVAFEYLFRGHHQDGNSVAVGRVRRAVDSWTGYRATDPRGQVTAFGVERVTALRSLIAK
jgi:hypothetical protein